MSDPNDSSTNPALDALLKKGQETILKAQSTGRRIDRMLSGPEHPAADDTLKCPECFGKAFRPYPVSKGAPEFLCVREDCQTQFRAVIHDGRIVKVETLN